MISKRVPEFQLKALLGPIRLRGLLAAPRKEPSNAESAARKVALKSRHEEEGYVPILKDRRPLNNCAPFKNKQPLEILTTDYTTDDISVANYKLIYSYGPALDMWHLSYWLIRFEDNRPKENWESTQDTATFIDLNNWVQEEIDDPEMRRIGFFCLGTHTWGKKRRLGKAAAICGIFGMLHFVPLKEKIRRKSSFSGTVILRSIIRTQKTSISLMTPRTAKRLLGASATNL
jgi:hypothetical protein